METIVQIVKTEKQAQQESGHFQHWALGASQVSNSRLVLFM